MSLDLCGGPAAGCQTLYSCQVSSSTLSLNSHLCRLPSTVANFDPDTFSVMHCEFCSAGFDTRAGLSSHARAHLRDFGITNWDVTISPIHILRELFSSRPDLVIPTAPPRSPGSSLEEGEEDEEKEPEEGGEGIIEVKLEGETSERTLSVTASDTQPSASPEHCKKEDSAEECEGKFSFIDPSSPCTFLIWRVLVLKCLIVMTWWLPSVFAL